MTVKQYSLSSGKKIKVSRHTNTEIPHFYPQKIVHLGNGTVGLIDPHSEYFVPTPKHQQKLEKITKRSRQWYYICYLARTR